MKPTWRILCDSGTHCETCRADAKWRADQARYYAPIPDCPRGYALALAAGPLVCGRCGASWHTAADCPIPANYRPSDYARDSRGTEGCSCA